MDAEDRGVGGFERGLEEGTGVVGVGVMVDVEDVYVIEEELEVEEVKEEGWIEEVEGPAEEEDEGPRD